MPVSNFIDTAVWLREQRGAYRAVRFRIVATNISREKCGCLARQAMGTPHVHTAANIRAGVRAQPVGNAADHIDIPNFTTA